jgi:predicted phage tail protein
MKDLKDIKYQIGNKGGGDPYIPVEEPDSLQSKAQAKIVDLVCEGEIQGWANGSDSILKSTYLNEVPVISDDGTVNFEGITVAGRKGTSDQDYLRGYDAVETENSVNQPVTNESGGYELTPISDSDVDDVRVTLAVQNFLRQEDDGDIRATTVNYKIWVKADGGDYTIPAVTSSITGKTTSTYQKAHLLSNISQWGSAPWTVKVTKETADSTSVKLSNTLFISSYTTIKNVKLRYPDSVVVGLNIDAEKFGNQVPLRYYKIKAKKIRVPDNYAPSASNLYGEDLYSGTWDGETFNTAWSDNPAWVLFDLLTDTTYGLGLDDDKIDVYSLYTAGIWCDEEIEYKEKVKNALGTYDTYDRSEKRFTFNGVIQDRRQALEVINHLASVINAFPIWSNGQLSIVQDRAKEVTRVASFANVLDGEFSYEGSPRGQRHTVARVQYSDPNNFNKPAVVTIQDDAGLRTYGYNPVDIVAFGCNNRNQAIRRAKLLLYTDLNNTDIVSFTGGIEWATAEVGEIIEVQDPNMYVVDSYFSGRVVSGTPTSITLDRAVELDSGKTYTLHVQTAGAAAEITTLSIPSTQEYTTLTWGGGEALDAAPETDFVYTIYCTETETARRFMISAITEIEFGIAYQVQGILYDPNKWTTAEGNLSVIPDTPPQYQGEIEAPTSLDAQVFTYQEGTGSAKVRKYGVLLSWVNSDDARVNEYEVRYSYDSAATSASDFWETAGTTGQNSLEIRDLFSGVYKFAVRARAAAGSSVWVNLADITVNTALDTPPPPRNLYVKGTLAGIFSGQDCHVEWDSPLESTYTDSFVPSATVGNVNLNYKVEVRKIDNTLLRTFFTASDQELEYTYNYGFNQADNSGNPLRTFRIDVYTQDSYGSLSVSAASLVCSNPAPSMASSQPTLTAKSGYLRCAWDAVADNDMDYYEVYFGTSSTNPNTLVEKVKHPNTIININDVASDSTYYAKIVPYDAFGIGVQSQISDGNTPLQLVDIDVQTELEESIKITDSVGSDIERLRTLYDFDYSSGGLTYKVGSGDDIWIQYEYAIDTYVDRCVVYMGEAGLKCYFAYSMDGENFDFLKANPDHTLAGDDADTLLYAVNQADAKANYWSVTAAGKSTAIFPNNIAARYVRIYLTRDDVDYFTTIHEFVPNRIIISELAALGQLSAITANIGEITAGSLRSENFGATAGMAIDLDLKTIYFGGNTNPVLVYNDATGELDINAAVTFRSGSTGYDNITDKPTIPESLQELDPDQDANLNGTANLVNEWSAQVAPDETYINGGSLWVGSQISLSEGGQLVLGNDNILMETGGTDTGRIIIAADGGWQTNDYALLEDGDLKFYYWDGTNHQEYKSVKRIEVGSAENNTTVYIPGVWRDKPEIIVSPKNLRCYEGSFDGQDQDLQLDAVNINQYTNGKYRFTPRASLQIGSGTYEYSIPEEDRLSSKSIVSSTTPNMGTLEGERYYMTNASSTKPTSINVDAVGTVYYDRYWSKTVNNGSGDGWDGSTTNTKGHQYVGGIMRLEAQILDPVYGGGNIWVTRRTRTSFVANNSSPITQLPITFGTITRYSSSSSSYIKSFRIKATFLGWQSPTYYTWASTINITGWIKLTCRSISVYLPDQTTLAEGSLNWWAIGS